MPRLTCLMVVLASLTTVCVADSPMMIALEKGRLVCTQQGRWDVLAGAVGFGPRYAWAGAKGHRFETDRDSVVDVFSYAWKDLGRVTLERSVEQPDAGKAVCTYVLSANKDVPLTYVAATFDYDGRLAKGAAIVQGAEGQRKLKLPVGIGSLEAVSELRLLTDDGQAVATISISPARRVVYDNQFRVDLSGSSLAADKSEKTVIRITYDEARLYCGADAVPDVDGIDRWFEFSPSGKSDATAAGLSDWLHTPAGKHGFVRIDGKDLRFEDGKAVRFWGTNVEYAACAPQKEVAERKARWLARYGINAVRQHKLTNPGWEGLGTKKSASTYDPEKLDRFDYFNAQLRANGIYYGFSPIWDLKLFEGDRRKLRHYDELKKVSGGGIRGFHWFFDDIQDLYIETMLNLLTHRNPYTELRYADDPALAYVEIQNEDNVFFYTTMSLVWRSPSYKKELGVMFCDWLRDRYGSESKLMEAWGGKEALNFDTNCMPDESLKDNTILPVCNPWMLDNMVDSPVRPRLLDTARFLYACQQNYYRKMTKAIREAGYRGPLVGSPWQAGSRNGHLLNLHSDASVGIVDRHNYTGGGTHRVYLQAPSTYNDTCLLDVPGGSLLSTGLQQVADRPFSLSEWVTVVPARFGAADTAVVAAYGMGLQGWDMSYFFASNHEGFTEQVCEGGRKIFNNQVPHLIGIFPALSRMVLRGDVKEAPIISERPVHLESLFEDRIGFSETTVQEHDIKSFTGDAHHSLLAAGRCVYRFTDEYREMQHVPTDHYRSDGFIESVTGQLHWRDADQRRRNWISINTPGTQAAVGFLRGERIALDDVVITSPDEYACIFLTAMSPEGEIANDDEVLLTVMARVRDKGMKYAGNYLLRKGRTPMIIEPVKASLRLKRSDGVTVYVCDHDGRKTDRTVPIAPDGTLKIDTGADKAMYYLLEYDE